MVRQPIGKNSNVGCEISILTAFHAKKSGEIAHSRTEDSSILGNIDIGAIICSYTSHVLNRHIINGL